MALVVGGLLLVPGTPARAEDPPPALALDPSFVGPYGKLIEEQPASLRDCAAVPGGATTGTDGWVFDQPVPGASVIAYVVGFVRQGEGGPAVVLIGVTADGLSEVPPTTDFSQLDPADLPPAPAGVTGGLLDAGGAWLGTPHGWRLGGGALLVDGPAGDRTTFALTAVCLPGIASSPAPTPTATPTATVPATPPASEPAAAPVTSPSSSAPATLPITGAGPPVVPLAAGSLLLAIGAVLLLAVRRQRGRIRFRP